MTSFPSSSVDATTLKQWLQDGAEIAVFDVREHGEYGEGHLFFGVPLPFSRLELDVRRLAPRSGTRIVLYDAGDGVAAAAAGRLADLGYTAVHVLADGTRGWQAAGFALLAGVNVPSKTFGELVEQACHTPRISAGDLAAMRARGERVVILDGRPVQEYRKMTIPSSICCPNGELAYRVGELVDDPATPIVVNCAGRTRSIIGAQTLINLGLPNPVMALENGTQGWFLEDLPLEHGSARVYPSDVSPDALPALREASRTLAARAGVPEVDARTLAAWAAEGDRTVYLCDVRTPEEFAAGSLRGAQHAPGGQLVQATDQYIGVRHARLVLFDSDGVRAPVVASWLRQLGHDAHVLAGGLDSGASLPAQVEPVRPVLERVDAAALAAALADDRVEIFDVRASMRFRDGHIPGARWTIRPRLPAVRADRDIVLVADDEGVADLCRREWLARGAPPATRFGLLDGGMAAWARSGGDVERTPDIPPDAECIDYLFFVHDRHDGNKAAARQYLAWETGLLAQLDASERDAFRVQVVNRPD